MTPAKRDRSHTFGNAGGNALTYSEHHGPLQMSLTLGGFHATEYPRFCGEFTQIFGPAFCAFHGGV